VLISTPPYQEGAGTFVSTKRTRRRTVEEEIGKVGKTWKEAGALAPKTGSAGDASWQPYAPEGAKGNTSK
jgi:hypothetical protein